MKSCYAGCPEGRPCLKLCSLSFFIIILFIYLFIIFFMVASNVHINLFMKLCPLLVGMYCSDCPQQKRPNEIHYWRVYHERGDPLIPTCMTSNHHLIYSLNLD